MHLDKDQRRRDRFAKLHRRNMLAIGEEVGIPRDQMLEASAKVGARFHSKANEVAAN